MSTIIHPQDANRIRVVWLGMLSEVPITGPAPDAPYSLMCTDQWTTPLGLLCQVCKSLGLWSHPYPPEQLENPPINLALAVGLRCRRTQDGEAVGGEVEWINAMTDAGVPYPQIATTIRLVQAER